jgi:NADH-quinone oxidoreductase subunit M
VTVLVLIAGWEVIDYKVHPVLRSLPGAGRPDERRVRALDAMLFYVFFEGMLIPMFIIIGVWGGPRRVYATMKFFLYTFLGSVFMLVGLIYLYLKGQQLPAPDCRHCR